MANGNVFPLTSLQIGDLQSYLSHLSLFLASESGKLYILVDNRPWLDNLVSRPAQLWQLMVTKFRSSPFANSRGKKAMKMINELSELQVSSSSEPGNSENFRKWFSVVDAVTLSRKSALLPVEKLRNSLIANSKLHNLFGFIVFEVAWSDVRGINYLNELQTDTSLAMEAKSMRRWEFDSIEQAVRCISSWFPGTDRDQLLLREHLVATLGEVFYDAQQNFPSTMDEDIDDISYDGMSSGDESPCSSSTSFSVYPATIGNRTSGFHTPPLVRPYKRRKVTSSSYCDAEPAIHSGEEDSDTTEILSEESDQSDYDDTPKPTLYRDVLISFRFNDHDLPFRLKDIIMSDLRLLTLLEAGLPSWVIFLQSYPGFCHLYRPWMCPLARLLYIVISIVTVVIGFYDLYKNVPLLKATASRLFGPLFDWIETWEMVSRIRYLGTMLFLHNSQKAIKWFLMATRTIRSCLSVFIEPLAGPFALLLDFLLPIWNMCIQLAESIFSVTWMVAESSFTMVGDIVKIVWLPFWYILLVLWKLATFFIYPVVWMLGEILFAPFRLVLGFLSVLASFCAFLYDAVRDIVVLASSIFQFSRNVESTVSSYEVSLWRSLWNDLFSQIFRALRSILNGFVVFFSACNRHRLSIYNHLKDLFQRLSYAARRRRFADNGSQSKQPSEAQVTQRFLNELHHRAKYRQGR